MVWSFVSGDSFLSTEIDDKIEGTLVLVKTVVVTVLNNDVPSKLVLMLHSQVMLLL